MSEQKTKNIILVVATAWGTKHGGINSFNKAFCIELAKYIEQKNLDYEIYCSVYDHNVVDYTDALKHGVTLITLDEKNEKSVFLGKKYGLVICEKLGKKQTLVKYVILHDVITGDLFNYRQNLFPTNPKWVAIHHMHYSEYIHLYNFEKNDKKFEDVISQFKLFKAVDFVFAVGPLLKSELEKDLRQKKHLELFFKLFLD